MARPVVLGEDPGLLAPQSDATGLTLTMLWFLVAVGWAVWRLLARHSSWTGSLVETSLAAVVGLHFLSTLVAAPYKHAAWLVAWEWLALLVAFYLISQLARTADDNRGLLAALLASGVSLSAYAVYQYLVEIPHTQALLADPARLQEEMARQNVFLGAEAVQMQTWRKRIEANNAFATYAHPNSFAGLLALLLPPAAGVAVAGWRQRRGSWLRFLPATGVLLLATGLWLTHSRGAVLALLLVGGGMAVVAAWSMPWQQRGLVLAGLLALAVAGVLAWRTGLADALFAKDARTAGHRLDYWKATGAMIRDHFWLGVGPGNFSRFYPRYMSATAVEKIQDPHNWLLEIVATAGIFAGVALTLALAAFFWRLRRAGIPSEQAAVGGQPRGLSQEPPLRWEFYLGGMAGLLIGFLLRAAGLSQDEILTDGLVSGMRSVIWFLAFAAFDGVAWSGRWRSLSLAGGVAALLLNLTVSGGISAPSVALPLWALLALTLAGLPQPPRSWEPRHWLGRALPVPLTAAVAILYFVSVYRPVTAGYSELSAARQYYGPYADELARATEQIKPESPARERLHLLGPPARLLAELILRPLAQAHAADPDNVVPLIELAHWKGEQWKLNPVNDAVKEEARRAAEQARRLDPEGRDTHLAEARLRRVFAQAAEAAGKARQAQEQYGHAARALQEVVRRDPTEAGLRYELADALFRSGNAVEGREQARKALELDEQAAEGRRRLDQTQRQQIHQWLAPK